MKSYMISYAAESYDMKDLAVLSSKEGKIWLPWKDIHKSWLEKMHVQALLACKMMVCSTGRLSSICFFALHLKHM